MRRCRWLLLLLLLAGSAPAQDVLTAAQQRQAEAEQALSTARATILQQRTQQARELQEQIQALAALRTRVAQADRARDAALTEAARARAAADQDRLDLAHLVEEVLLAAHLDAAAEARLADATPAQRLAAGLDGIRRRIAALPALGQVRYGSEEVVSRRGTRVQVPVLRLGQARAVALGEDEATRGPLARSQDGRLWVVQGALLPKDTPAAPALLRTVPLDPDNTLILQTTVTRSFGDWLRAGRFFIWPILIVLVLGVGITLDRVRVLLRTRVDAGRLAEVLARVRAGTWAQAEQLLGSATTPLERILRDSLAALSAPRPAREAALEHALLAEAPRLQRGLGLLMVLASIAPLLGLLGTVTGMIDMFSVIATHGSGNARSLSGSISEALVTTQAGMIVAVPLLVAHAVLARAVERRLLRWEEAGAAVLALEPPAAPVAATAPEAAS